MSIADEVVAKLRAQAADIDGVLYYDGLTDSEMERIIRAALEGVEDAFISLSSELGHGPGSLEWTTTEDMVARIRAGVDTIARVEGERRRAAEAHSRELAEALLNCTTAIEQWYCPAWSGQIEGLADTAKLQAQAARRVLAAHDKGEGE